MSDRTLSIGCGKTLNADKVFLARNYLDRGNAQHALSILQESEFSVSNAEHLDASLLLVQVYKHLSDYEQGNALVSELLKEFPDNNAVLDAAISVFSDQREQASTAKELALDQIAKFPNSAWYYYVLAHIGRYYLDEHPEKVIENLEQSLKLSGHMLYLDDAYELYDYYDQDEKRDQCLSLMVEKYPEAETTQAKLFHNLRRKGNYREAAEVAMSFAQAFPMSRKISEYAIRGLRRELIETKSQRYWAKKSEQYWNTYERLRASTSPIRKYLLAPPLLVLYYIAFPFLLPSKVASTNHQHLKAFAHDPLYRRLCSSRDHFVVEDNFILLYCPDSSTSVEVLVFEGGQIHKADTLLVLHVAAQGFDPEHYHNLKTYKPRSVKHLSASKSVITLETSWSESDIEYSSPDTIEKLEEVVRKLGWRRTNTLVMRILTVVFTLKLLGYISFGSGALAFYLSELWFIGVYFFAVPAFWSLCFIRSMLFTSRIYSYRPKRLMR